VVLHDNIVKSESEGSESMVELDNDSNDGVEYAAEGEALVTRHILNFQVKEDDIKQ